MKHFIKIIAIYKIGKYSKLEERCLSTKSMESKQEQEQMIEFKINAYIVGIWYAERINFGRVFIYAIKGNTENEWIGRIKYEYNNQNININLDPDSHFNTFMHSGITENIMMKICQDRIDELHCTFNHYKDKLLVRGDYEKLEKVKQTKSWFPSIRQETTVKKSKYVRSTTSKKK